MTSFSPSQGPPAVVGCCDHPSRTVSVSLDRLQRLEACEARAELQERHIELLQKQVSETDAILKLELARGEKHAETLMHIARTCDERTSEMREQHAAALRVKDVATTKMENHIAALQVENAALKAKHVDLTASHVAAKEVIAALKAENTALKAQAASTLAEIHAAVTTGAMEILPVRFDSRLFVEWRVGGIPPPPPPQFDRAWSAAVSVGGWKADVDAAAGDTRATVTQNGWGFCTLRGAAPLPRGPTTRVGPCGGQRLPAYRVIVEAYGWRDGEDEWCRLGFVPSQKIHRGGAATAIAPQVEYGIQNYGGWAIVVWGSFAGEVDRDTRYSGCGLR
jgi:hypothetical protein